MTQKRIFDPITRNKKTTSDESQSRCKKLAIDELESKNKVCVYTACPNLPCK